VRRIDCGLSAIMLKVHTLNEYFLGRDITHLTSSRQHILSDMMLHNLGSLLFPEIGEISCETHYLPSHSARIRGSPASPPLRPKCHRRNTSHAFSSSLLPCSLFSSPSSSSSNTLEPLQVRWLMIASDWRFEDESASIEYQDIWGRGNRDFECHGEGCG